jgi:thioredoxin 1
MNENIKNLGKADFRGFIDKSDGPVLVDFWAPWCGPCRAIGPELEAVAEELKGRASVAKVNVDDEPELAKHYGIQSIPNLLIFKQGQPVRQLIGLHNRKAIKDAVAQVE